MKRCKVCKEDLSPVNPSGSNVDKVGCKKRHRLRQQQPQHANKAAAINEVSWQPWQPFTHQEAGPHLILPHQRRSAHSVHGPRGQVGAQRGNNNNNNKRPLTPKSMPKEEIPFLKMDSPFLKKVLGLLGATLPGEVLLII